MAESFQNSSGKQIVLALIHTIQVNAAYLSEIDGAIGDGDHGINMNKGFTRCQELISDKKVDFTEALYTLGKVLLDNIGGAMGPLYGSFFIDMASISKGADVIDKDIFGLMLKAGLESIEDLGSAKVGDKTILDSLVPAYQAYITASANGESFEESLVAMSEAAERGKESTRQMVARVGRSSRLGERSRGVLDAGATSCYLLLSSFANSIISLNSRKQI
jgi:phosphoenolpyruvate---glycerone phosphotransferase subunit DhaL